MFLYFIIIITMKRNSDLFPKDMHRQTAWLKTVFNFEQWKHPLKNTYQNWLLNMGDVLSFGLHSFFSSTPLGILETHMGILLVNTLSGVSCYPTLDVFENFYFLNLIRKRYTQNNYWCKKKKNQHVVITFNQVCTFCSFPDTREVL